MSLAKHLAHMHCTIWRTVFPCGGPERALESPLTSLRAAGDLPAENSNFERTAKHCKQESAFLTVIRLLQWPVKGSKGVS